MRGFRVVVLLWCVSIWRIPVAFRLWRPKQSCRPKNYRKKTQLAWEMMVEVYQQGLDVAYVSFDARYTAGWLTKRIDRPGLKWVGVLLSSPSETIFHWANEELSSPSATIFQWESEEETKSLIKRVLGIDKNGAYLVYAFDGKEKIVDLSHQYAKEIAEGMGGENLGTEMGEEWWLSRYKFFFPPYAFALPQAFGTCDTVALYKDIERVYLAMKKAVKENFPNAIFIGHFSHWFDWGCMLYARFIVDNPPEDPGEALELYNSIWDAVLRVALKENGVLNEHHGIGLKLGRLMKEQYKNSFALLKNLKKDLDPNNIMNPGKMGLGF